MAAGQCVVFAVLGLIAAAPLYFNLPPSLEPQIAAQREMKEEKETCNVITDFRFASFLFRLHYLNVDLYFLLPAQDFFFLLFFFLF